MGAAGAQLQARHLHDATTYGILAMDIFVFGNENAKTAAESGDVLQRRRQED